MANKSGYSIAIIGGGASAVLLLAQFARDEIHVPGSITIYDRSGAFARGIAYGTKNPAHLLNVRAANMSVFQQEPAHFAEWLAANRHSYESSDFVPRVVYAAYLEEVFKTSCAALQARGCAVDLRKENIRNLQDVKADIKILATGNAIALRPEGIGYHENPWTLDYSGIKGDVIIIGTGLSMVDAALSLRSASFAGKITAISRRGLLPGMHITAPPHPAFKLPYNTLGILRTIRKEIRETGTPWQTVIDSLRPVTNDIWLALDESERKKARRLMTFWNVHRHRMAPEIAAVIADVKSAGSLTIIRDDVKRVEEGIVHGRKGTYRAAHIINCLGYSHDASFGFSFADEKKGVFALGPALAGLYFETTAIPEIRAQAADLAARIPRS